MKTIADIKTHLGELVDFYTGPTFKGVLTIDRGYHLVRAIDNMVDEGWFAPYRPVVNYHSIGTDEIHIEVKEFHPLLYKVSIKKGDCNND